jgi:hypothetical protein
MAVNSDVELWATAISTHASNGRKIIFRFAKEFNPAFARTSQPIRIIIAWKYESETGMPSTEELQRMDVLEDALDSVLYQDSFATLALVSTGEDLREWTYYAKSEDGFSARFDYAISELPEFPIEIHSECDANWDMYEQFKAGMNEIVN